VIAMTATSLRQSASNHAVSKELSNTTTHYD
jgi:hypothetical protein